MQRSTRLLIAFSVLVSVAALFLLAMPNVAQSDIELTATKIISDATQTSMAFGTPIPPEIRAATLQSVQATRTAIAITREPYLLTPQTPDAIELTATRIMANYELTMTAYVTPNATELAGIYTTATFIVQRATQTAVALTENPSLAQTIFRTPTPVSCEMGLANLYQADLSKKIGLGLQEKAELNNAYIEVITNGVGNQCGEFHPIGTLYRIVLFVNDFSDENLRSLAERILAFLQNFPADDSFGKTIRLHILFEGNAYYKGRYIDTGYINALSAYDDGLRGVKLIEALGGILDI